jgi:hypothetical protein
MFTALPFPADPRAVTDADFPAQGTIADRLTFLLHYAVLAPSVLNTQPWRFSVEERVVHLYADRTRQLRRLDPAGRELTISCGAALYHLRVAARHFGHEPHVHAFPYRDEPDLLATFAVPLPHRPTPEDDRLFHAIQRRFTYRHPFSPMPVPADLTARLVQAARSEGARLVVLESPEGKRAAAELIAEGIGLQGADRPTVDEIRGWLRSDADPRRDGVRDRYQGEGDRLSGVRAPSSILADWMRDLTAAAPALLVLTTAADVPRAWLAAGQALGRVLLTATAHDFQASYANQPAEVEVLRPRLADLAGGGFPQLVFRLGRPIGPEGTPRRPVQDVLDLGGPETPARTRRPPHAARA